MRISIFILIVIIVIRMIYDLTFNPVEAIINIIYKNGSDARSMTKQALKLFGPCLAFAVVWSAFMPDIIAYYGQPFQEETHILSQMPMYGNDYLVMKETMTGERYYRYMLRDAEDFSETDKSARHYIIKSDTGSNSVNIIYQEPREKAMHFFFMDALTWPTQRKDVEYTFSVVYD